MAKRLSKKMITDIKLLRKRGASLPEIHKRLQISYGTIYRYTKNVKIDKEFYQQWLEKRGGSKTRMKKAQMEALEEAKKTIQTLNTKEKIILLTALYWAEGSKLDFSLSNTDPEMIRTFVSGLKEIFNVKLEDLKLSIRIYEDLDKEACLNFWSNVTGIPVEKFVNVNILKGKKIGKLQYGMCRVRIKKGGKLLKYMRSLKNEVLTHF